MLKIDVETIANHSGRAWLPVQSVSCGSLDIIIPEAQGTVSPPLVAEFSFLALGGETLPRRSRD